MPTPKPAGSDGVALPEAPKLKPLTAPREFVALEVEGFRPAVVALPRGITEPRPILLALHGNYDRPEWQCQVWNELLDGGAFVLCPRGIPRGDAPKSEDRWTYGALNATLKEVYAGLAALRAAYPDYVDPGPAVFTGFSLGAILGVHALGAKPKTKAAELRGEEPEFSHAVLIEGGYQGWYAGRAKQFRAAGGLGVLFACGQHDCKAKSAQPVRVLSQAEVPGRVAFGGNVGHSYGGAVSTAILAELPWLLGTDPRWVPVVGPSPKPN